MVTNNTFRNSDQQLNQILSTNIPEKVLIVPIDFAKNCHIGKFCFANGSYLYKKPVVITNNIKGANFLEEQIEKCCTTKKISPKNVIIATEDPHSYARNFFHHMQDKGYLVVQVNAFEAKKLRNHGMASSDKIDLDGIANSVINRKAVRLKGQDDLYQSLMQSSRTYHALVKESTRRKNQMDKLIDQIFPGLLSESKSGLVPYGNACMTLLKKAVTPQILTRWGTAKLEAMLRKNHVKDPEAKSIKLIELAKESFSRPGEHTDHLRELLKIQLDLYEALRDSIDKILNQCKKLLLQTPYCLIMSIPGIAEVRALTMASEFGSPEQLGKSGSMCAFAGIVPKTEQTGGPSSQPMVIGLPQKCNRRLKNAILSAAHDQANCHHPAGRQIPTIKEHRFHQHYNKVKDRGGKSGLSTARIMIKVIRSMVKKHSIYMPEHYDFTNEELATYVEVALSKIYTAIGKEIFAEVPLENNFLVKISNEWKQTMKDMYAIDLQLPF